MAKKLFRALETGSADSDEKTGSADKNAQTSVSPRIDCQKCVSQRAGPGPKNNLELIWNFTQGWRVITMNCRTLLSTGCLVLSVLAVSAQSSKADWMFAPPIYKKQPPATPLMMRPQVNDGPYYTQPQGEFTSTSMRYMNSFINIQGRSYDDYQVRQTTVQQGGEF